jgi:hypothetical protein
MVAFGIAGVNDGFCADFFDVGSSGAAAINADVEGNVRGSQINSEAAEREVPERSGCVAHHVDREERSDWDADCVLGGYWSRDI